MIWRNFTTEAQRPQSTPRIFERLCCIHHEGTKHTTSTKHKSNTFVLFFLHLRDLRAFVVNGRRSLNRRPEPSAFSVPLWLAVVGLCGGAIFTPADAQLPDQHFEVIPETTKAAIGDPVSIRFRLRLDERDLLYDTVPRPVDIVPEGVRILSVEKLQRGADRIFSGRARIAFYRLGPQAIPIFGLPFMRSVKGVTRATVLSDSASVEIVPVLPAGNPSLRDIKELDRAPGPPLIPLALAAMLATGVGWYLLRRRRRQPIEAPGPVPEELVPEPVAPDAYEVAVARLDQIEAEGWPSRGEVARHYQAVADTLRDYLKEGEDLPARERTTAELLWSLPPHLAEGGLRRRCEELLDQADLVKFARVRPDAATAAKFTRAARDLLASWHRAEAHAEAVDALR
jgi:hypothetical protein